MRTASATSRSTWWAQALQNRFIALVLAMIVIVPLLASPADIRLSGIAALTFEAFALLLAATLLWRAKWSISREQFSTFLRTGANLPVLMLMGLALVYCAMNPNMFAVQETLKLGAGVLLYFVVAYQFRQSKHLFMLVDTLLFLAIAVSFVTMAQYTVDSVSRGTALFGNQQPLGSLLMVLLPIVAVLAMTEENLSKRQIAAQIATVMTAGALLLAFTRSAWMGAAVGLAAMGAMHFMTMTKQQKNGKTIRSTGLAAQKHKFVVPVMLALVTTGFFGAMLMSNQNLAARMGSVAKPTEVTTFQERQQVWWAGAVAMIKARPLTGWGPGQYAVHQRNFTGEGTSAAAMTKLQTRGNLGNQAHNYYLQTAAELGIPGLLLVVGILGAFFMSAGKRIGSMDAGIRRSLLIGSMAAVAAFAVDALSSPSWQFAQVSMFFWLILGAGVSCMRARVKQEEEAPVLTMAPRLFRPVVAVACALMFALLVLPTATLTAHASHTYGHNNNDDDDNDILIFAGILLAAGFLFNAYNDDDDEDTPPPPPPTAVIVR